MYFFKKSIISLSPKKEIEKKIFGDTILKSENPHFSVFLGMKIPTFWTENPPKMPKEQYIFILRKYHSQTCIRNCNVFILLLLDHINDN